MELIKFLLPQALAVGVSTHRNFLEALKKMARPRIAGKDNKNFMFIHELTHEKRYKARCFKCKKYVSAKNVSKRNNQFICIGCLFKPQITDNNTIYLSSKLMKKIGFKRGDRLKIKIIKTGKIEMRKIEMR